MRYSIYICYACILACCSCNRADPWTELFNGKDLSGWSLLDGSAHAWVEPGMIMATQDDTASFTYLATDEVYSDFILELELKITGELNTGVMIRGNSDPGINNGRLHGFQMEIDQSERQWTGGIYEEAGRLWLTPLEGMEEEQKAYNRSDWNHYRIEATGQVFRIWVNGVPTTHLIDSKTASGIIGFQIHKRPSRMEIDTIRIRNIRIITEKPEQYSRSIDLQPVVLK